MVCKLNKDWDRCLVYVCFAVMAITMEAQSKAQKIGSLLAEYHERKEFNGAVLVAKNGTVLFKKGYGYADIEKGIPIDTKTKFSIGSTTKSFTACAIMQQVEKGTLDLHEKIATYIPQLKSNIGRLTLHQLLKNTSGLPVHLNRITELKYRDITSDEIITIYNDKASLSFEPGTSYEYSNLNYQLASIILERVTGLSFEEYLTTTLFLPLHMANSGLEKTSSFPKDKALGYHVVDGRLEKAKRNYMAYAKGGGNMYSSVEDLFQWDQALYGEDYVSISSKQKLFDGNPNVFGGYGYGFKIKSYLRDFHTHSTGKLVRHGGSMYGYVSNIHRYLDDRLTIIILGNIRPFPIMEIVESIEQIMLRGE